jgi:AsmA protein
VYHQNHVSKGIDKMNKVFKWLLILFAGFAIAVLALVLILPRVFDPNEQKDKLQAAVSEATGRSFEIQGEIEWSLFPNLGFSAGPMVLGNAKGFQSDYLARIGEANISGKVEVGEVVISDLRLELEVNADGANNWDGLTDNAAASGGGSGSAGSGDPESLRVEGLTLEGRLRYRDQQQGLDLTVDDISLRSSALEAGQPLSIDLEMLVTSELLPGPMAVETAVQFADPLATEVKTVQVQHLAVNGAVGEEGLPLVLEVSEAFDFDLETGSATIDPWVLTVGPAVMRGNVRMAGSGSELSGRIDVASFDARELLRGMTGSLPQFSNPQSLAQVAFAGNWRLSGDAASITGLQAQLDGSKITGQIDLNNLALLEGDAQLEIDEIDLDQYMAASAETEQEAAGNAGDPIVLPKSKLNAELKIGRVRVAGLTADNVSFNLESEGGGFKLFPVQAELYQGQMNGGIQLRKGANGALEVRNSLKGVNAAPLLADLSGSSLMSGIGNLAVDVSFAQPFAANPWRSANGRLEFRFKDGAIHGVDVMGIMRQAAQLLGRAPQQARGDEPSTDFSSMVISAVIENGVMTTPKMVLSSPFLRVTGKGSINLANQTLDYVIEPMLLGTPEGQADLGLDKLKGIAIPVTLGGHLDEPQWTIDPAKLLLASQREKLGEPAAKLLEAISGEGNNDSGDETDLGKNLLDSLLNEAAKRDKKKKDSKPDSR